MIPNSIRQLSCDEIALDELDGSSRIARFASDELGPLVPDDARIITFDGFNGVGKSTLARHLATKLNVPILELDDFLNRQQDRFLEALDFPQLSSEVGGALDTYNRVIVEGCLVEAALERVDQRSNFRFYVMQTTRMRSNPDDEWVREHDILYGDASTETVIAELQEVARRAKQLPEEFGGGGSGDLPNLERENILYHRARRPHDRADIIVKIVHWS
ncbi:MAG: hypothetical protein ACREEP_20360 [Dongiaceae bacterium]